MARPSNAQMVTISNLMAARALARAADPATRDHMIAALRSWLPETDVLTLRELADGVAADFMTVAQLVEERLARLQDKGLADAFGEPGSATRRRTELGTRFRAAAG